MTDLSVATPGPELTWSRMYASQALTETDGTLGYGWQHNFGERLILPAMPGGELNRAIIFSGRANQIRFTIQSGQYLPDPGVTSTLTSTLVGGSTVYTQTLRDQRQLVFDGATGRLKAMRDAQGRNVVLNYTGSPSRLTSIADAMDGARTLTLGYDANGRINSVSDGAGRSVGYGYDANGNLTSLTDVMLRTTSYIYQTPANHLLTKITRTRNGTPETIEETTYDTGVSPPRAISQLLQDGRQIQLQYFADKTVVTTTRPGAQTEVQEYVYAADNTLAGVRSNSQAVQASAFDANYNPTTISDGEDRRTQTAFNAAGLPTSQTNGLNQTTQVQYDSLNRPIFVTDTLGIATGYQYDQYNNVTRITAGITTTSAIRSTTIYTYSYNVRYAGDSLLVKMRRPDGVVIRYDYPASGTVTQKGQISSITVGDGLGTLAQVTTYTYDPQGRITARTAAPSTSLERKDTTTYNADNTIAQTIQNYKDGVFTFSKPDEDIITTFGYDEFGRQIWVKDVLGHYDVTSFNAKGQVAWTVRNLSGYSGGALPVSPPNYSPTQPDANVATFYGYDDLGRTVLVTQTGILAGTFNPTTLRFAGTAQRVTKTEYDALSRPVTVTLDYGGITAQSITYYDGASNPIWQRDAISRWTKTEYDGLNRPVKTIANYQDGSVATNEPSDQDLITVTSYDAAGRLAQQIDNWVDGTFGATDTITDRVTLYQYDTLDRMTATIGNATSRTGPDLNRVMSTLYDPAKGLLIGSGLDQQPSLAQTVKRWTNQQYDALGRTIKTIQNCTNGSGQPQNPSLGACAAFSTSNPDRNVPTQIAYDALNRVTDTTDALTFVTRTSYDGLGRTIKTTQHYVDGVYSTSASDTDVNTSYRYDALGRTLAVTDTLGFATRYVVNNLGQTTQTTDQVGRVTLNGYDGTGALRWTKRPDGQITLYQMDGLGRTIGTIVNYQDGVAGAGEPTDRDLITQTSYDLAGRRTQTIDPASRKTVFDYDNADRLIQVTENSVAGTCSNAPCNVITQYRFDRAGNQTKILEPIAGHVRSFTYTAADEQQTRTDALLRTTTLTYDNLGRLIGQADPRGVSNNLTLTYDGLDRLKTTSATNLGTITNNYDALGRRISLLDGTSTTNFTYDALGRMLTANAPNTGLLDYKYNGLGQRTKITYPGAGAPVLNYIYANDGRLQTVQQGTATLATYAYDAVGRLAQVVTKDATTPTSQLVTNYGYDGADRLRALRTLESGALASRFQYQNDRLGMRTVVTETLPLGVTPISTRLKTITFEAASPTDPTSGADSVNGTVLLTNTTPLKEFYSAVIPNVGDSFLREDFSGADDLYLMFYLRVTALPSSNNRIAMISNSGTTVGNVQLTTSGKLRLRNNITSTTIGVDSPTLSLGTLYRVGIHQKKSISNNGVLEAYLATGDAPFGAPFASSAAETFTTQATRVQIGATTSTAAAIVVDNIALDTAAMPAPWDTVVTAPALFQATTNYSAGFTPRTVVSGDVNNDGKLDLVVAGRDSEEVRVLLGNGLGGFGAPTSFDVGPSPVALALGDLNNDGKLDLAVALGGDPDPAPLGRDYVSVLIGHGDGTFEPPELYIAGTRPIGVTFGDLNNDGKLDLAAANQGSNNVSVLIGNGTGGFSSVSNVTVGTGPSSVAIGDITRDGKADLAVANGGSSNVSVRAGNGDGTFQAATNYTTDAGPDFVALSDLNRDGLLDLVTAHSINTVNVRLAQAGGGFAAASSYTVDTLPNAVAIGDINNDGKLDLATSNWYGADTSVLVGNGDGTFQAATHYPANGGQGNGAVLADFNRDGKLDFVMGNFTTQTVSILLGTGGGVADTAIFQTATNYSAGYTPRAIVSGDLNRDGKLDLVVAGRDVGEARVLLGNGTGGFGAPTTFSVGMSPVALALGDLNNDGKLDLVAALGGDVPPAPSGTNNVAVLLGNGSGGFGTLTTVAVSTTPAAVALGDLNNDGKLDLATANRNGNNVSVLLGNGAGGFGAVSNITVGTAPKWVAIGDITRDGKADLAVANSSSGNVSVRAGNGDGTFQAATNYTTDADPDFVALSDLNRDGLLDLVTTHGSVSKVNVRLGQAGGGFAAASSYTVDTLPMGVAIGDINNDGALDLATANWYGADTSVLVGIGDGTFQTATQYPANGGQGNGPALGDFNRDGKLDFVMGNFTTQTVSVMLHAQALGSRVVSYAYDGLQRLTGAVESPGSTYAYGYDLSGNRTSVQINGVTAESRSYDAANQVIGWTYDEVGNLRNDGVPGVTYDYDYDALNRLTRHSGTSYVYNGDGTLVSQTIGATTTRYTQDLAAPLSQILETTQGSAKTQYFYGLDRLAAYNGTARTWYIGDALGSVRRTFSDAGAPVQLMSYDPWGASQGGVAPTFGFTGELQDPVGLVNLRARWYHSGHGTFTSVDPFEGFPEQPYSLHPYQYAYSDPILYTDPTGRCSREGDDYCYTESGGDNDRYAYAKILCVGRGGDWDDQIHICRERLRPPPPDEEERLRSLFPKKDKPSLPGYAELRGTDTKGKTCVRVGTEFICLSDTSIGTKLAAAFLLACMAAGVAGTAIAPAVPPADSKQYKIVYRFADRNNPNSTRSNFSRLRPEVQAREELKFSTSPIYNAGKNAPLRVGGALRAVAKQHATRGAPYNSPFVSVLVDHARGAATTDPWLSTIIWGEPGAIGLDGRPVQRAPDLGEFKVPVERLVDPQNALSKRETELLFYGDDLDSFRVRWMSNPYYPPRP